MANRFQIKRTTTSGRTPNTTSSGNTTYIAAGELAINLTDDKLFSSDGTTLIEIGSNLSFLSVTGNVGIGTTSLTSKLNVYGTNTNDSAGYWTAILNNTAAPVANVGTGIAFSTNVGTFSATLGTVEGIKENATTDNYASALKFTTRANGGNITERMRIDSAGNIGIGNTTPTVKLAISSTDAMLIPVGTTAQRPTGNAGYMRFNSNSTEFEGYNGNTWSSVGTASNGLVINAATVIANSTVGVGYNAMSVGPITIANGVSVSISSGQRWLVF